MMERRVDPSGDGSTGGAKDSLSKLQYGLSTKARQQTGVVI
jgi:hypothetical protein